MTTFHYLANDSSGNSQEGDLEAHSLQAARDAVTAMGLTPIEIYERNASAPTSVEALSMDAPDTKPPVTSTDTQAQHTYFPFVDTLRLYAGWLLAWYCIVYAIGSYQFTKELPFRLPYAESLFLSPLVLSFTFAAYLFLLLSGLYTYSGRKKKFGLLLLVIGIALFILYRMNVQ